MEQVSPRRIVVADDNEDSAQSFAMLLSFSGHEVRIAHDGEQALDVLRDFRPDFAFLDIGMPRLSGYEVAEMVRAAPWGRDIKLIAVTGWSQPEDRLRAHSAGFDQHLVKPIDPGDVERLLDAWGASPGGSEQQHGCGRGRETEHDGHDIRDATGNGLHGGNPTLSR